MSGLEDTEEGPAGQTDAGEEAGVGRGAPPPATPWGVKVRAHGAPRPGAPSPVGGGGVRVRAPGFWGPGGAPVEVAADADVEHLGAHLCEEVVLHLVALGGGGGRKRSDT